MFVLIVCGQLWNVGNSVGTDYNLSLQTIVFSLFKD